MYYIKCTNVDVREQITIAYGYGYSYACGLFDKYRLSIFFSSAEISYDMMPAFKFASLTSLSRSSVAFLSLIASTS